MRKPTFRTFTKKVELDRARLALLLQGVADRAYEEGHRDGVRGAPMDPKKVEITEKNLCKIK